MTQALITFAVMAWLLQIALGWWQIQRFNRAFDGLCRLGAVGVGRSGGRFQPRVVLALAFDSERRVCGSMLMRGPTETYRPAARPASARSSPGCDLPRGSRMPDCTIVSDCP